MADEGEQRPESLLPYDEWTEDALRLVAVRALEHVAREGLPGKHHFYLTFRTDHPGVTIPARLRAQYPQEMTIILQHQFWDLKVEGGVAGRFSVGLSFGGIPSMLVIPFAAISAFADPQVGFGLRFNVDLAALQPLPETAPTSVQPIERRLEAVPRPRVVETPAPEPADSDAAETEPQVVSLDAFRRRSPSPGKSQE